MNFRKTSKRPLTPPRHIFGKQCCAFFGTPKNLQRNSFGLAWPPPLFPKIHCFYRPKIFKKNATKFFGVQRPHPISLPKKRNEIFRIGNDPPPIRKFSENSSNLVQVVFPNLDISFLQWICLNISFFAQWSVCLFKDRILRLKLWSEDFGEIPME